MGGRLLQPSVPDLRAIGEASTWQDSSSTTGRCPRGLPQIGHTGLDAGLFDTADNNLALRDLHQIGGSHAQRDIFFQIMIDSALKAGRETQARILLDDIAGIGFDNVSDRTLYRDAVSALAA